MPQRGGTSFTDLVEQARRVQDCFAGAGLPSDVAAGVLQRLSDIADVLAAHQVDPLDAPSGERTSP
ncbi:hypothetical protein [Mycobacterium sp. AZCC_0083]|uniref:hypothetical protein n=1 Tax=Mycobacterium sp. AZCC_0083 TaxID=2735882 RepID=UPI00161FDBA8|nr:hypothetical protein [Mycobacterium sp. AZCC_0083]MBB5160613.1 hypothetical protein [Mycobacterium sp. AZCC_0083]